MFLFQLPIILLLNNSITINLFHSIPCLSPFPWLPCLPGTRNTRSLRARGIDVSDLENLVKHAGQEQDDRQIEAGSRAVRVGDDRVGFQFPADPDLGRHEDAPKPTSPAEHQRD